MGGGRGTRLHPLTKDRCKPAVPLAGKYRLIDIPISNCLNSGYNNIYILTQYNTASLHRHIQDSYKFDPFSGGFVDILAAEQTMAGEMWYQGTADAVRQNLLHFHDHDDDLFLILSGDQLFRMDCSKIVAHHLKVGADVTIAAKAMPRDCVHSLGVMRVDDDYGITEFVEKPKDPAVVDSLVISDALKSQLNNPGDMDYCLASMGIYVFKAGVLRRALDNNATDFGKEVIPSLLGRVGLFSYLYDGYWEDIGTVKSFFDANLMLTDTVPEFNFFDTRNPVYTHARFLPASKLNSCTVDRAVMADGCIVTHGTIRHCVIGIRTIINAGAHLEHVVTMGADRFETNADRVVNRDRQIPDIGIGANCRIENAIIDKNARIGENSHLSPRGLPDGFQEGDLYVRDGILVVSKNGIVPANTKVGS